MIETRHSFASGQQTALASGPGRPHNAKRYLTLQRCFARPGNRNNEGLFNRPLWLAAAMSGWFLVACIGFPRLADAAVDAATVQRAIDRGIAYLRKSQNPRGGWPEYGNHSCGLSSLCVLALLNCGVSSDDPQLVSAMRYLRTFEPQDTYSVSLQTLVYCQLGAAGDLTRIRRNVEWLVAEQNREGVAGERLGAWSYGNNRGAGDPSNTQFALLALGAAEERGVEVEPATFQLSLEYWQKLQREDGGWAYGPSQLATGSMTCAGIASLIIAQGRLSSHGANQSADTIECCGAAEDEVDRIGRGIDWLARHYTLQVNPGGEAMTLFYYLYALERAGRLSGRRFIGDHDWYREGAERLVGLQDELQGFWAGVGFAEDNRDVATSFALLFLSKGKRQVVIGKLDHSEQRSVTDWNHHPDAMRQLVRHVERDWGRDLTWQTIAAEQASVEDLLQAPVLVISGREPLKFSADVSAKLADYLDQGGCILFDSDSSDGCGDAAAFRASVERLCSEWFPDAPLEPLPPDHAVWFAEHRVDPESLGAGNWIEGVQACCRTPVFFSPRSLSCRWSFGDLLFRRGNQSPEVRRQIENGIRLGENVIAYATGRELKDKLQQRTVIRGDVIPDTERGVIRLASLTLDAGGDQAERALPNAATLIRERIPMRVAATGKGVSFDPTALQDVGLLWIHGRQSFVLTADQRDTLRGFIESGGLVLANAICADDAFAESFRREMAIVLPESPLVPMPASHPAWTTAFGGFDVSTVAIRTPDRSGDAQAIRRHQSPPRIEFAAANEIASVFFSPLDLSCALESQNSIQCEGYSTEDAVKIVANLLLYGLQQ